MNFKLLLLFLSCLCLLSCTDADEVDSKLKDVTHCRANICYQNISRSTSATNGLEEVLDKGYNSVENDKNMKLLFNSELANSTGLTAGNIYIVRYETYRKLVNHNGAYFFPIEINNVSGLRIKTDLNGSYISNTERGYNTKTISATEKELETHLLHVISDMSGVTLNIYYPCRPSEIIWYYKLYIQ